MAAKDRAIVVELVVQASRRKPSFWLKESPLSTNFGGSFVKLFVVAFGAFHDVETDHFVTLVLQAGIAERAAFL